MIQQLYPDEHSEPDGRLLEELVMVCVHVEFAELQRQIRSEPWWEESDGVDYCLHSSISHYTCMHAHAAAHGD